MNSIQVQIPQELEGSRLDKALASLLGDYSRTTIQSWIAERRVRIDGEPAQRRQAVSGGEHIEIDVPETPHRHFEAQNIPLEVVYQDESIIVVNKPAGLVVHPGAGQPDGTMLNALLHHDGALAGLARAGIVHRLDKNTSGLLVVARTEAARLNLIGQLKDRSVERDYLAIVEGVPISGGTIDAPIGRHPKHRTHMAVGHGRSAVSHFRIVKRFRKHALVRISLDTGRTHQIRVHLRHAGYPLAGDPDYGSRPRIPKGADPALADMLRSFRRQALHAESLGFNHPVDGEPRHWHKGLPRDMRDLILALKADVDKAAQ